LAAEASAEPTLDKIVVRIQVGVDRMAGTDDPVFLHLSGPAGRDFRLQLASGKTLRKGALDTFVLGAPGDPETNVKQPELNDPTSPPLTLAGIDRVAIHKGFQPLPNVRGVGEMDDRIELTSVEVEIQSKHEAGGKRFRRDGPIWLGLVCGLSVELGSVDGE
jgi:hypothetical protein